MKRTIALVVFNERVDLHHGAVPLEEHVVELGDHILGLGFDLAPQSRHTR